MHGHVIAIEGIDGSGKGTQAKLLHDYLFDKGHATKLISFPRYSDTFFGKEVGNYLNGSFGSIEQVPAKLAAILYAGDRFESKELIFNYLNEGSTVILDRYVSSNVAHHAAKIPITEREAFVKWVYELEYKVFGMPKPDIEIYLDIPFFISKQMVALKDRRDYTNNSHDLHEENDAYLKKVSEVFSLLCAQQGWSRIECSINGVMRSREKISSEIVHLVSKLEPAIAYSTRLDSGNLGNI